MPGYKPGRIAKISPAILSDSYTKKKLPFKKYFIFIIKFPRLEN